MVFSEFIYNWLLRIDTSGHIEIWPSLLVFFVVVSMVYLVQFINKERRLPPGPWGYPLLGSSSLLNFLPPTKEFYKAMAKKFGSTCSIRIGRKLVVVLSDYLTIRQAFKREEFTGRPSSGFSYLIQNYGIINSEGQMWKSQRRFLHDQLRTFGMKLFGSGKEKMETRIMGEVESLLRNLAKTESEPTDLNAPFSLAITNVICSLLMSVRFKQDDPRFIRFTELIEEGFKLFSNVMMVGDFPFLRHLPGFNSACKKIEQNKEEMGGFFQEMVNQHRDTFDPEHMRDLIDTYLLEIKKAESEGRILFCGKDCDRQMQQIIGDIYSAGMETIKTTLLWYVVYMLHNPGVLKRMQDELDAVVGRERLPQLSDQAFLPYTECVINEVLRISSIVPLGTTHATTKDLELDGHFIPKDSHIIPQLSAVHMDPNLWEAPEQFNPTRFLNAEGKVVKPEFFMPFGVGRRMCLGDVLARMELFLFASSLVHTFDIKLPEGAPLPNLDGNEGVTITPDSFKVCLQRRTGDFDFLIAATSKLRSAGSQ
ncbi:cytochrome P450 18a1 [Cloeon dipterum]|uniref:cytochrome P450 18a1 n=1 Tax=Cloeon dipterum TaxID=197152 RepID=UPI00321FB943